METTILSLNRLHYRENSVVATGTKVFPIGLNSHKFGRVLALFVDTGLLYVMFFVRIHTDPASSMLWLDLLTNQFHLLSFSTC